MSKRFTRVIEDFVCERCGVQVGGGGYTNHCPSCIWSKHVDINPGDRRETCEGLMEPVSYAYTVSEAWVVHRCIRCGHEKKNKLSKDDNLDTVRLIGGP